MSFIIFKLLNEEAFQFTKQETREENTVLNTQQLDSYFRRCQGSSMKTKLAASVGGPRSLPPPAGRTEPPCQPPVPRCPGRGSLGDLPDPHGPLQSGFSAPTLPHPCTPSSCQVCLSPTNKRHPACPQAAWEVPGCSLSPKAAEFLIVSL